MTGASLHERLLVEAALARVVMAREPREDGDLEHVDACLTRAEDDLAALLRKGLRP